MKNRYTKKGNDHVERMEEEKLQESPELSDQRECDKWKYG
jgi:hypothetical protein